MIRISIDHGHHNWEKQNLVTLKGGYDLMKCKGCGIEGKRKDFVSVTVKSSYSLDKINLCPAYVRPVDNNKYRYTVKESPWSLRLPVGTEIVEAKNPKGNGDDDGWYKRKDGKLLFEDPGDEHGCFKLHNNEVTKELI